MPIAQCSHKIARGIELSMFLERIIRRFPQADTLIAVETLDAI